MRLIKTINILWNSFVVQKVWMCTRGVSICSRYFQYHYELYSFFSRNAPTLLHALTFRIVLALCIHRTNYPRSKVLYFYHETTVCRRLMWICGQIIDFCNFCRHLVKTKCVLLSLIFRINFIDLHFHSFNVHLNLKDTNSCGTSCK